MNLFVVTSPFQYICALEAKYHYQTKNNILLLINQNTVQGRLQQDKLIRFNEWDHVIQMERTQRAIRTPLAVKAIKKLLNGSMIERFFYAEYNGFRPRLLLNNLPIEQEVYFDDGTLTINEYEDFIRPRKIYKRKRWLQDLVVRVLGCQPNKIMQPNDKLEIFTIFDIKDPEHKIIENKLSLLQQKYQSASLYSADAPLGFIGQGAIGDNHGKQIDDYLREINYFVKTYNRPLIYFPHRSERAEVKNKIEKIENLTYHSSILPLEIELLEQQIKLSGLVGIYSTAQYTAIKLYPDMPIYNLINLSDNKYITSKDYVRIREIFQRSRIEEIDL